MKESLHKDLLTGHYTTSLDQDGTLTITEMGLRHNRATGELEPANTMVILPPQAARGLLNLLHSSSGRKLIGARELHK